ncbi:MAG: nucleoside recognition domain-containing protein [Syntrophomonas sp.]
MSKAGINQSCSEIYDSLKQHGSWQRSELGDQIIKDIFYNAENIANQVVQKKDSPKIDWDSKIDDILTSHHLGYPIMVFLLGLILWITLKGANIPSQVLSNTLFAGEEVLNDWLTFMGSPAWLTGMLVMGMYKTLAWVVAVMLPPMAIFFPLFTFLEDLGYLPRISFNLDSMFKKVNACGKQALTMCMGFGCNAAGVTSCRIIDSSRERLLALLTNNFVPCNGRFPILITISTIFIGASVSSAYQTTIAAAFVTCLVLFGIATTFLISALLSKTLLRGETSSAILELPPYRKPQIGAVIYRSILDRTIFVLLRAVSVAAPAGAITWILGNVFIGDLSIIAHLAAVLNPVGQAIGLDGFILLAFILGLPANEIVLPILLMSYLSTGHIQNFENLQQLKTILINNGWTWLTAVNMMLFSLLHWPCTTTLLTMYRETGSKKWTFLAFVIPTTVAFTVCFLLTQTVKIWGWL